MSEKTADPVNHPKHYGSHPSDIECIQVVEHMNFNLGNVVKYVWRADEKDAPIQDLEKAAWYLNREITRRRNKLEPASIRGKVVTAGECAAGDVVKDRADDLWLRFESGWMLLDRDSGGLNPSGLQDTPDAVVDTFSPLLVIRRKDERASDSKP